MVLAVKTSPISRIAGPKFVAFWCMDYRACNTLWSLISMLIMSVAYNDLKDLWRFGRLSCRTVQAGHAAGVLP